MFVMIQNTQSVLRFPIGGNNSDKIANESDKGCKMNVLVRRVTNLSLFTELLFVALTCNKYVI